MHRNDESGTAQSAASGVHDIPSGLYRPRVPAKPDGSLCPWFLVLIDGTTLSLQRALPNSGGCASGEYHSGTRTEYNCPSGR